MEQLAYGDLGHELTGAPAASSPAQPAGSSPRRLPARDQALSGSSLRRNSELTAQLTIAEHLCELGEDLQVRISGAFRDEEDERHVDWPLVRCVERDR